jgi:hypothetical protein
MRRVIISAVLILGLGGAVTFALAQPKTRSRPQPPPALPAPDHGCASREADKAELHSRVARLRAEVELLQLEHDALKASLSDRLKHVIKVDADTIGEIDDDKIAAHFMRAGAEKVGKAAEFDTAIQEDLAALEKATQKAREIPTELHRKKEEFLRLATELNGKRFELIELEKRLDHGY